MQLNQGSGMSRKITRHCVVLLLTLTSVSAARRCLNSINELRNCHLYEDTNILPLLYWFANIVDIDGVVIQLTFNPNYDYGSHHYRNSEWILDPLPSGYKYYTVGNINRATSVPLPSYVVNSQRGHNRWNTARIIFRLRENNVGAVIDQVYITQHPSTNQGTSYDPQHTYEITVCLLRQIRKYSLNEIQQPPASSQIGPFENASYPNFQQFCDSKQNAYVPAYDTINQNDCECCGYVVVVIVLILFALFWIISSNWGK